MLFTNVWYIAEESANVTDLPVKVRMLGRDFVLFRDEAGKVVCLSNVCIHRGASLAQGKCNGDGTVACPFHGWRFGHDGRCTKVPSQSNPTGEIPAAAKTDSYPTQEKYGLIWVFVGDSPEQAHPVFDMPEYGDPAWRMMTFSDTWKANVHWVKMVDLDQVHLHIVHGIPLNEENPSRPSEHEVEWLPIGFQTKLVSHPKVSQGSWQELRKERTTVTSRLAFYLPGFTLRGQVDIGTPGSGFCNLFYSMSTPIDEENTKLYLIVFRNFLMEEQHDKDHLNRNLRNVYQDKAIAEGHFPKRAPDLSQWPVIRIDREDRLMSAYWELMRQLRGKGWQIDRMKLDDLDRNGLMRVIPSPARRSDPANWVYETVPFVPADPVVAGRKLGAA